MYDEPAGNPSTDSLQNVSKLQRVPTDTGRRSRAADAFLLGTPDLDFRPMSVLFPLRPVIVPR